MRNIFRSILALAVAAAVAVPASAEGPYRGRKSMGVFGGYATRAESAAAGIYFNYRFARCFVLAPSADYVFRHSDEDGFNIDLNAHVPLALDAAQSVSFYPIGGVGYSAVNRRMGDDAVRASDSRHRVDRFGVNVGGGVEWLASPTLRLAFEGKWRWRTDYSTGLFTVSIGYIF